MARLTGCPYMTLAVDHGYKALAQTPKLKLSLLFVYVKGKFCFSYMRKANFAFHICERQILLFMYVKGNFCFSYMQRQILLYIYVKGKCCFSCMRKAIFAFLVCERQFLLFLYAKAKFSLSILK